MRPIRLRNRSGLARGSDVHAIRHVGKGRSHDTESPDMLCDWQAGEGRSQHRAYGARRTRALRTHPQRKERDMTTTRKKKAVRPAEKAIQFKVQLRYLRPPVWRRVVLPDNATLGDLHQVVQLSRLRGHSGGAQGQETDRRAGGSAGMGRRRLQSGTFRYRPCQPPPWRRQPKEAERWKP